MTLTLPIRITPQPAAPISPLLFTNGTMSLSINLSTGGRPLAVNTRSASLGSPLAYGYITSDPGWYGSGGSVDPLTACFSCPIVCPIVDVINFGREALGVPIGGCCVAYRSSNVALWTTFEKSCVCGR